MRITDVNKKELEEKYSGLEFLDRTVQFVEIRTNSFGGIETIEVYYTNLDGCHIFQKIHGTFTTKYNSLKEMPEDPRYL